MGAGAAALLGAAYPDGASAGASAAAATPGRRAPHVSQKFPEACA